MDIHAIKDLLYRLADDKLIIGHRMSEWIGMGPILEEDIAFASMAQDEVGHSQAYYNLLHDLGEDIPDKIAFMRSEAEYRSSHFVEYPIGDYAFSLMRHYLFDMADMVRLKHLSSSSYRPLASLATKLSREEKYHQLHGRTWVQQLSTRTEEAKLKMQAALTDLYPAAFGLFEPTQHTPVLEADGVQPLEDTIMKEWRAVVEPFLTDTCGLKLPDVSNFVDHFGGRSGHHTPHLAPLLLEMTEVFRIDPEAIW